MSNITQKWVDLLIPFSEGYGKKMTSSEIAKKTMIPQQTSNRIMNELVKKGLVDYEIEGRNKLFFLDLKSLNGQILMQIVENHKSLLFLIKNRNVAVIIQDLKKYADSLIVFGSYASSKFDKRSDLDLIVFSGDKKRLEKEAEKFPLEINCHYTSYSKFKKLLKEKNALAIEVFFNHVFFGNVSKLVGVFLDE